MCYVQRITQASVFSLDASFELRGQLIRRLFIRESCDAFPLTVLIFVLDVPFSGFVTVTLSTFRDFTKHSTPISLDANEEATLLLDEFGIQGKLSRRLDSEYVGHNFVR